MAGCILIHTGENCEGWATSIADFIVVTGSIIISHVGDSYFWVTAKFSGIGMKTILRVYSIATLLMGLTSILMVFILSKLI